MTNDELIKELYDYIKGYGDGNSSAVIPCRYIEKAIEALKAEQDKADCLERLVASNTRNALIEEEPNE